MNKEKKGRTKRRSHFAAPAGDYEAWLKLDTIVSVHRPRYADGKKKSQRVIFQSKKFQKSVLRIPQEVQQHFQTVPEGHPDTRSSPGASPNPDMILFTTL